MSNKRKDNIVTAEYVHQYHDSLKTYPKERTTPYQNCPYFDLRTMDTGGLRDRVKYEECPNRRYCARVMLAWREAGSPNKYSPDIPTDKGS